jgi:hypothetical protein
VKRRSKILFPRKIIPMPHPEFSPGVRFSAFDALLLAAGAFGAWFVGSQTWWLGFVIAFVVGHFFLFCDVFRISRGLELIWAAVFLTLTGLTLASGQPTWTTTAVLSLASTAILIGIELRKPSYHGIGWSRINPGLPRWWESQQSR